MTKRKYEKGERIRNTLDLVTLIVDGQSVWIGHRVWNAAAAKNLSIARLMAAQFGGVYRVKPIAE